MPLSSPAVGAVTIQVVLDRRAADRPLRWLAAVAHSASIALREGRITAWEITVGVPDGWALESDDAARLKEAVSVAGGALEVMVLQPGLHPTAGHNRLAEASTSDALLFLQPGALMSPDTVDRLCWAMTDDVGLVGARELPLEEDQPFVPFLGDTAWVSTKCALTPRGVFVGLGGFDAGSFVEDGADVDYSWRVRLSGLRVVRQPSARIFRDQRLKPNGEALRSGWDIADRRDRRRFRSRRRFDAVLAELLLAHKYADGERLTSLRAEIADVDADGASRRALAEFDKRRTTGSLPAQVAGAERATTDGFSALSTGRGL